MRNRVPLVRRALRLLSRGAACAALGAVVACGGGSGDSGRGSVQVALTDAPACGYDHVNITVQKVRVHMNADAADNDAGWAELVLSPPQRIDLLSLQNGVLQTLGTMPLPAGDYHQIRLVLAPNDGSSPPANSVVPSGGSEVELKTPSGQQSGVKVNAADFTVAANQVADLTLDFDACKSIVRAGNSGQILLKPVIRAIPVISAAGNAIEGFVDPALIGATVSAQQAGTVVKSTAPDSTGKFVLSPVMAGTYDLVVTAPGHASAVVTSVPASDTARTTVASSATPLALAADGALRSASGAASLAGSATIPDATIAAVQALTGGPTVEVASVLVDPDTGAYSLSLPTAATGTSPYAAGATSYTFASNTGSAAKYTLNATATGKTPQSANIDLTSSDATGVDFVFP